MMQIANQSGNELIKYYFEFEKEINSITKPMYSSNATNKRLDVMEHFLDILGKPQNDFPSIHITGTSGKGSTSAMTSSILVTKGVKTGLFLSPHVQILNERFVINGKLIPTSYLVSIFDEIKPAILEIAEDSNYGRPSLFETFVAIAFCLFRKEKVDVAVVEVGIGGSFDATNVLNSNVSVITSVGLDHTKILGNTIEEIAVNKSGIIKPQQVVISGVEQPSVKAIVSQKAHIVGAELWQLGETIKVVCQGDRFSVYFPEKEYKEIEVNMLGGFQIHNAACAIGAVKGFVKDDISESIVREGINNTYLPGRMEVVQDNPTVVLDGAHNYDKVNAVIQAIVKSFPGKDRIAVIALKSDKNFKDIVPIIAKNTSFLIATSFSGSGKSLAPEIIKEEAKKYMLENQILIINNPLEAVDTALEVSKSNNIILVTGSLHLVGNVRKKWFPTEAILAQLEEKW